MSFVKVIPDIQYFVSWERTDVGWEDGQRCRRGWGRWVRGWRVADMERDLTCASPIKTSHYFKGEINIEIPRRIHLSFFRRWYRSHHILHFHISDINPNSTSSQITAFHHHILYHHLTQHTPISSRAHHNPHNTYFPYSRRPYPSRLIHWTITTTPVPIITSILVPISLY